MCIYYVNHFRTLVQQFVGKGCFQKWIICKSPSVAHRYIVHYILLCLSHAWGDIYCFTPLCPSTHLSGCHTFVFTTFPKLLCRLSWKLPVYQIAAFCRISPHLSTLLSPHQGTNFTLANSRNASGFSQISSRKYKHSRFFASWYLSAIHVGPDGGGGLTIQ
jgi:hypothetical protein